MSNGTTGFGSGESGRVDYTLHVDMIVPVDEYLVFERAVSRFLERNDLHDLGFDKRLLLALRSVGRFPYSKHAVFDEHKKVAKSKGGRMAYHYVHLWQVNRLEQLDLAANMIACADDAGYTTIDNLVLCEVQDLVRRVHWSVPDCDLTSLAKGARFARTIHQSSSSELGRYLFRRRGDFVPLSRKYQPLSAPYQSVTGALDLVFEFWKLPGEDVDLGTCYRELDPDFTAQGEMAEQAAAVAGTDERELDVLAFDCPDYFLKYLENLATKRAKEAC